jgi:hypothetical protein
MSFADLFQLTSPGFRDPVAMAFTFDKFCVGNIKVFPIECSPVFRVAKIESHFQVQRMIFGCVRVSL